MDKGIIQGKSHFINHVSSQHSGSEVEITQEVRKISSQIFLVCIKLTKTSWHKVFFFFPQEMHKLVIEKPWV